MGAIKKDSIEAELERLAEERDQIIAHLCTLDDRLKAVTRERLRGEHAAAPKHEVAAAEEEIVKLMEQRNELTASYAAVGEKLKALKLKLTGE
jgi:chromosome segregation ATPase